MSKYIELEDAIYRDCILIDEIKCEDCPFYDEELFLCRMVKWLESLPTIDIVHCKDCKYKRLYDGETKYFYCALEDRPNRNWSVDEWNFCWWGERIEE